MGAKKEQRLERELAELRREQEKRDQQRNGLLSFLAAAAVVAFMIWGCSQTGNGESDPNYDPPGYDMDYGAP